MRIFLSAIFRHRYLIDINTMLLSSLHRCRALLAIFSSLLSVWCMQARAIEASVKTDNVAARVVTEHNIVQPGQRVAVMLHQTIRSGWHTYWVNPGDSGESTKIHWQLPVGATAEAIQWPTPQPIRVGPLVNYGYSNNWSTGESLRACR